MIAACNVGGGGWVLGGGANGLVQSPVRDFTSGFSAEDDANGLNGAEDGSFGIGVVPNYSRWRGFVSGLFLLGSRSAIGRRSGLVCPRKLVGRLMLPDAIDGNRD
jgi:hypothetical protein